MDCADVVLHASLLALGIVLLSLSVATLMAAEQEMPRDEAQYIFSAIIVAGETVFYFSISESFE